jgi:hypothetical protein
MVLVGGYMETSMDSDWDVITEAAIDVVTIIDDGRIKISLDLSYDNGIIIKEIVLENVDIKTDLLIQELNDQFFNSVNQVIDNSLEFLVRTA